MHNFKIIKFENPGQITAEIDRLKALLSSGEPVTQPIEVYSRIVGYYRILKNWNPGKKEEFWDRVTYDTSLPQTAARLKQAV